MIHLLQARIIKISAKFGDFQEFDLYQMLLQFTLTVRPELLVGTDNFKKHASELVKKVRSGRTKNDQKIHIPGYDTEVERQAILDSGEIEMGEKLIQQLKEKVAK